MKSGLFDAVPHSLKNAVWCLAFVGVAISGAAKATTIANGGFETGTLDGWTKSGPPWSSPFPRLPNGANVYGAGIVAPGGWPFFTSQPSEGNYAFLNEFDGPAGTLQLTQNDILVTADAPTIAFDYRAAWAIGISIPATKDRTFDVKVVRDGVSQLYPILTAQHGEFIGPGVCDPSGCNAPPGTLGFVPDTGLLKASIDLTPFVGQTVSLVFEWNRPESFTGPAFFQLDNVRAAPIPEPETYAMMLAGLGLLGLSARRLRRKLNA